ncbi:SRPBCC family protein [Nocardioides sp. AN3]
MAKPNVMTFERRIPANAEAVWAVMADPHAMTRTDRSARLVSTSGGPGEVGSRYSVAVLGVTMERVVTEAVTGSRLVLQKLSPADGRVLTEWRADLRDDGDATVLSWTVIEAPPPLQLNRMSAHVARFEVPRWLAKVEQEALAIGN